MSRYTKPHGRTALTVSTPHLQPRAADLQTADSIQNFLTRTGIGTDNINSAARYGFNPVTRNRMQMEWVYRGSWIAGMAVDTVAKDMTREGAEVHSDDEPDKIEEFEKEIERLQVWKKIGETIKWARLYGGSIGFLMIDGQQPNTPLKVDTIREGQFRGILPMDRWMVQPSLQDVVTEMGPDFGLPKYYDVLPDTSGLPYMRIHHSRVIRLVGVELPYWQRVAEMLWGQSVLERLWDRLIAFDSTTAGVAQLVYKAHLRTIQVKGLRSILASDAVAEAALVKWVDMIRRFQSNEGITLIDAEDVFATHQYTFSGLSDVLLQFGQQISGALGIPLVRLFGQSPAGLNSTGESDLRMYYDSIKQEQEEQIRPGVEKIYGVAYRSKFGKAPPKAFTLSFRPLWQMSDEQRANVTNVVTAAVNDTYERGIIDRQTALKELRQLSTVTGTFSNITDEMIEQAEDEPLPPLGEVTDPAAGPDAGQKGEGKRDAPANEDGSTGKDVREAA